MKKSAALFLINGLLAASAALAHETQPESQPESELQREPSDFRWEGWLALTHWSGLNDLQPQAGGSFDTLGFGLGGGVHWSMWATDTSELLLGGEVAVLAHGSDIPSQLDDLLGRDAYIAVSAKWMLGSARNFSLDAGYGYHLMDISQIDSDYWDYDEFESWEESAGGPFVGFTWDTWAGKAGKNGGLSLGFKVHFVDFGTVRDEDIFFGPVLGPDAGKLDDPLYFLQIGYSSR